MSEALNVVRDTSKEMTKSGSNSNRIFASVLAKEGITGLIAAGTFNGTKEEPGPDGAETFVLIQGVDGVATEIRAQGNLLAQLRLNEVAEGNYIEVSYYGKQIMKTGPRAGKEAHKFSVNREKLA